MRPIPRGLLDENDTQDCRELILELVRFTLRALLFRRRRVSMFMLRESMAPENAM